MGQYLSVGDVYALQDTCGTGWVSRVPRGQSLSAEIHGATVSWGPETISAAGGALAATIHFDGPFGRGNGADDSVCVCARVANL